MEEIFMEEANRLHDTAVAQDNIHDYEIHYTKMKLIITYTDGSDDETDGEVPSSSQIHEKVEDLCVALNRKLKAGNFRTARDRTN
uniref:Uncharacterized protein n=2 Tax=Leersia perrieri TaxID=77586 RepID=A0A0D9WY91_9ORYZ